MCSFIFYLVSYTDFRLLSFFSCFVFCLQRILYLYLFGCLQKKWRIHARTNNCNNNKTKKLQKKQLIIVLAREIRITRGGVTHVVNAKKTKCFVCWYCCHWCSQRSQRKRTLVAAIRSKNENKHPLPPIWPLHTAWMSLASWALAHSSAWRDTGMNSLLYEPTEALVSSVAKYRLMPTRDLS